MLSFRYSLKISPRITIFPSLKGGDGWLKVKCQNCNATLQYKPEYIT